MLETTDDDKLFKELEEWNILFDIFIDEERYDEVVISDNDNSDLNKLWVSMDLSTVSVSEKQSKVMTLLEEVEKEVRKTSLRIGELSIIINETTNDLWVYLFIAKKIRSIYQGKGFIDVLDAIAEYLLSKIPITYKTADEISKKLRIFLYNEISQCYKNDLTVGYAEKALREYPSEKYHYELLALYNKALGLSHRQDITSKGEAIKLYDEIIKTFGDENKLKKYQFNLQLWKMYVYYPSLIQKADILRELQRGKESVDVFKEFKKFKYEEIIYNQKKCLTINYKRVLADLIIASAIVDTSPNFGKDSEDIRTIENVIDNPPNKRIKYKSKIIQNRYKSFVAKKLIEEIKENEKYSDKKTENAFKICNDLYEEAQNDKSERVQAISLWLEAYEQFVKNKKEVHDTKGIKDNLEVFKKYSTELINIIDPEENDPMKFMVIKDKKTINRLTKVLEDVSDLSEDADTMNIEFQLCEILANEEIDYGFSDYHKGKFYRRLLILDETRSKDIEGTIIPSKFQFPTDYLEQIKHFANHGINRDFYTQHFLLNTENLYKRLIYSSYWPQFSNKYTFTVLRKWQSYTPSLGSYSECSRGGGYFIYNVGDEGQVKEGIIIDPGYDFIENFFEHGFSVLDIKAIVFTHSHPDHTVDFPGILTLIHEANNRGFKEKQGEWKHQKVYIIAPSCCINHFYPFIEDAKDNIKDVIVMYPEKPDIDNSFHLENFIIDAIPAYHKEFQECDYCMGLIIKNKSNECLVGFTGDTVWTQDLATKLENCQIVCVNMGALLDVRKGHSFKKLSEDVNKIKELIYKEKHLYLPGTIALLNELHKNTSKVQLAIIGEIGEEFRNGLRRDLFYKLNQHMIEQNKVEETNQLEILIEDTGLTITLEGSRPYVRCARCRKVIESKIKIRVTIDERSNEQISYYCIDCLKIIESHETGAEKDWQLRYPDEEQSNVE